MIYEMFKALAVNGLGWGEFAFAVVATVLLVHLLSWAAGVAVSEMYKYVQDREATLPNFMWTLWDKVWKVTPPVTLTKQTLNGWYKSKDIGENELWTYRKYKDGIEIDHDDYKASQYKPCPKGYNTLISNKEREKHILFGTPFYIAATFLIFDALPLLVISIATVYATLRLTRTVVRISKRVTKVEEEVTTTTATDGQAVSDEDD